jgi:hypothetical protein
LIPIVSQPTRTSPNIDINFVCAVEKNYFRQYRFTVKTSVSNQFDLLLSMVNNFIKKCVRKVNRGSLYIPTGLL